MSFTDTLQVTTPSDREIRLTRVFNAPRRLVFEAFTKAAHIQKWWGLKSLTMTECDIDFRIGGRWRFVLRSDDGQVHPFTGEYREIVPPERIVQTFIYDVEGIRDMVAVETMTLEERDGRTLFTNTILHANKEARDGHLASGMEPGAAESFDRLAELLRTMT